MKVLVCFLMGLYFLTGCSDPQHPREIKKKYHLRECLVRVDFRWGGDIDSMDKAKVIKEIGEQIKQAIVSNGFPLFSGHTVRGSPYYLFYYADRCEERRALTNSLIQEYFIPNIANFPKYTLQDNNIEPGFDGVLPSGWWLEE